MRQPAVQSRVIVNHRRGCYALEAARDGRWRTPWALPVVDSDHAGPLRWATRLGGKSPTRKRDNYHFVEYRCNDTNCPARVLISNDAILALADRGREKGERTTPDGDTGAER